MRGAIAVLAGAALTLSACGGGDSSASDDPAAASDGDGSSASASPLTGLPYDGDKPDKPVTVVKVDNTDSARPQVGLDRADLVVEELVEGGMTRLAAFYYGERPKEVGPIRSLRDSDVGVVLPTGGVLLASGGAPGTAKRLEEAGVEFSTEGSPGFSRDRSREAPYNLMLDVEEASGELESGEAPGAYLPFQKGKLRGGKPAKSVAVSFSSASTTTWKRSGGGWTRTNGPVSPKDDFAPDNLLALRVEVDDAGYEDPGGNPVPVTKLVGEGKAQLFSNGRAVTGTWSKDDEDSQLKLETRDGKQLNVPAGKTVVELVPRDGGSVRIR